MITALLTPLEPYFPRYRATSPPPMEKPTKVKSCSFSWVTSLVKVLCEGVVVVARGRLAGFAEASAVVGDDPVTRIQQDGQLLLPGSTAQRVSVDQDNRFARAMVFVVKLHVARIFSSDRNVWHFESPFLS